MLLSRFSLELFMFSGKNGKQLSFVEKRILRKSFICTMGSHGLFGKLIVYKIFGGKFFINKISVQTFLELK